MPQPDLQLALRLAMQAHAGQWRDGQDPLPYFCHVVEVLINLRHVGEITEPAMLCAAVLHDTVEVTSLKLIDIETAFGTRTAELVEHLTREEPTVEQTLGLTKDEIWELRARMLLQEITRMPEEVQTIKLADRLSNVREARLTKGKKGRKRYLWQTREILNIVPRNRNPGLWDAIKNEVQLDQDEK